MPCMGTQKDSAVVTSGNAVKGTADEHCHSRHLIEQK